VLEVGDHFASTKLGNSLEVLRVPGPDKRILELRRVIKPGTGRTAPHLHMDFVERFVVEAGHATAKLGPRTVELGPADTLEVPRACEHVNAYNAATKDLVIRHSVEPASDFSLGYFETLGHLMSEGRTDKQGETPLTAVLAVAHHTRSQTFAARVPHLLQSALLAPLGARLAKLRGYEVRLPEPQARRA
jgi:mannose-6-phosphate isomerase-like protein (cupin superfamily)